MLVRVFTLGFDPATERFDDEPARDFLACLARTPTRQYICITGRMDDSPMPRTKNEVLTIRTTAQVEALLKVAAERERRSA